MIILPAGYSGKLVSERPFHFENFFFAFIAPICGFSSDIKMQCFADFFCLLFFCLFACLFVLLSDCLYTVKTPGRKSVCGETKNQLGASFACCDLTTVVHRMRSSSMSRFRCVMLDVSLECSSKNRSVPHTHRKDL